MNTEDSRDTKRPRPEAADVTAEQPSNPPERKDGPTASADPKGGETLLPERLYLSSERIQVELYKQEEPKSNWERRGKIAADFGTVILGIASLLISLIALNLSRQTTARQNELKAQELKAADEERRVRFLSELNDKVFSQFKGEQDSAEKTLAAIRLSTYGEAAFPSIQVALGVREPTVRQGAVEVMSQMFQSGVVERSKLFDDLLKWNSDTRNPYLRRSTIDCFVYLIPYLDDQEKQQVTTVLKETLKHEDCSQEEGAAVILRVAVFIGNSASSEASELLQGIANNRSCLNVAPRRQAIDYLPTVAKRLSTSDRAKLLDNLRKLKEKAPEDIRGNIESAINQIAAM